MKKKSPKVSVIVPVCDVEPYLRECMDSLVNQTLGSDLEIIAINDGSTDGCLEILKEYARRDKRIMLIDQENQGRGRTYNTGIAAASGEYLAIMDGDDLALSHMYQLLHDTATEQKVERVRCQKLRFYEPPEMYKSGYYFPPELLYKKLGADDIRKRPEVFLPAHQAGITDRHFVVENGIRYPDQRSFVDLAFSGKCVALMKTMYCIADPLYIYRKGNPLATTSSRSLKTLIFHFDEHRDLDEFLDRCPGIDDDLKKRFNAYFVDTYFEWATRLEGEDKRRYVERMAEKFREMREAGMIEARFLENESQWEWFEYIASYDSTSQTFSMPSPLRILDETIASKGNEKKTAIFCVGNIGRRTLAYLKASRRRVECFLDNNPNLSGGEVEGIPVLHPDHLENPGDFIAFIAVYEESIQTKIADQLDKLGVDWRIVPSHIALSCF